MPKCGLFIGATTIDLIYRVERLPDENEKIVALEQVTCAGGPATNAAVTFAHLGGTSELVAALGGHPVTALAKADLARCGVSLSDLTPTWEGLPPVSTVLVLAATGERTVIASRNPGGRSLTTLAADRVATADAVLIDGHQMQTSITAAQAASHLGVPVVFDGGSWKARTEELLPLVDVAIVSANFRLPGASHPGEIMDGLRSAGPDRVAITRGERSILFCSDTEHGEIPVPDTEVVDSLGAGDVFHGAFCLFFAETQAFADSLRRAAAVASRSCSGFGTRSWMGP